MITPSVSVVIPTRARSELLAPVVAPLLSDPALLEVVLVVGDSTSAAAGRRLGDPRVRVLEATGPNRAAARELGARAARGEVLLFIDDDVLLEPGVVSGHVRHHQEPGRVVVGYMPVPPSYQRGIDRFPTRAYASSYERQSAGWESNPATILQKLWGGNVSIRRRDALRVGIAKAGSAGRYFEDWEFGLRCEAAGLVGIFDRSLRGAHRHTRTVRQWLIEGRLQGVSQEELGYTRPDRVSDTLLPAAVGVLIAGLYVTGALRLRRLEAPLAWRVRRLQARRGAREERIRRARDTQLAPAASGQSAIFTTEETRCTAR